MCELCNNNVYNCNNCYWGQVKTKNLLPACDECVGINHIIPTEWRPLGDTYCRKCGRKLKTDTDKENVCTGRPRIIDATLLSADEAQKLPDTLKVFNANRCGEWWLLGCGPSHEGYAYSVTREGKVQFSLVDELKYIRPALKISIKNTSFQVGDVFMYGGKKFKILSPELAWMFEDSIGYAAFHNNCYGKMSNFYSNSFVKKIVDEWCAQALLAEHKNKEAQ